MDKTISYGICLKTCNIKLKPEYMNMSGVLNAGSLFKVHRQMLNYNTGEVDINRLVSDKKNIIFEDATHACSLSNFKEIDNQLFLLLLAVKPEKRLDLIREENLITFIRKIQVNKHVRIPSSSFHGRQNDLACVVQYIGPVPQIGVGIFFGFVITDPLDSIPIRGTLANIYLRCDNSRGFIRAADVFYKRKQHSHNGLKSYPSVSSIDPFGSMESLSSERSFSGTKKYNPRGRNNQNNARSQQNMGMPLYNAGNTPSGATGMNLISFEPVNPNLRQARPEQRHHDANPDVMMMRQMLNMQLRNQQPIPNTFKQPTYPEPLLEFAPVPNTIMSKIIKDSHKTIDRDHLRQKYELLKKELDNLKNSRGGTVKGNEVNQPNSNARVQQKKYKCSLKSCNINIPQQYQRNNDYKWNGLTEFYTNSIHQVKCSICNLLKLHCYASNCDAKREFNAFQAILKESGFKVSLPENKYLAVSSCDKTPILDNSVGSSNVNREIYYVCTIRNNMTIFKNRYKATCTKCRKPVDTSQGICLVPCQHIFCTNCMRSHINSRTTPIKTCPDGNCNQKLSENEINSFMSDDEYKLHLRRLEESSKFPTSSNIHYCSNKTCYGSVQINDKNMKFTLYSCPVCTEFNCILCKTIHKDSTCDQYQISKQKELNAKVSGDAPIGGVRRKNTIFKCKLDKCPGYMSIKPSEQIRLIACPECNTINCRPCEAIHTGQTCLEYSRFKADNSGQTVNTDWTCATCTFINTGDGTICDICHTQKPIVDVGGGGDMSINYDDGEFDLGYEDTSSESSDGNQYEQLLELEDQDIIRNTQTFDCIICYDDIKIGAGVKLHDCCHEFCEACLTSLIKTSEEAPIKCPFLDKDVVCEGTITHREMKYLVGIEVYEQYLQRSLLHAQKDLNNFFQCKTADCAGAWCYDDNVACYQCPLCIKTNCHQCNAVHENMTCRDYQKKIYEDTNPEAVATKLAFEEMLTSGKALRCPKCLIVIVREEGCSWVVCAVCKTEICWATRGPRWGPLGRGDTSGGCKCNWKGGNPCHPDCAYCH